MGRFVVGVSGASGIILAIRAIDALCELGHEIEFVITPHALYTASLELGKEFAKPQSFIKNRSNIRHHPIQDIGCAIASGSYPTDGMIILPCSMSTVSAVSMGLADNALRRAADVTIKEKRPLILVPRETPLSTLHLENLLRLSQYGATIIPPIPAWYFGASSLEDMEKFIVGKVLEGLKIEHNLYARWLGRRT